MINFQVCHLKNYIIRTKMPPVLRVIILSNYSSMIHSARPIVTPVANIVFCCFVFLDLKSGDGRMDKCAKTMIPTGRNFGLAEWINMMQFQDLDFLFSARTGVMYMF